MAKLENYLIELKIGKNPEVDALFNLALKQVFSSTFLNEIEGKITSTVRIVEKSMNNQSVVAWNKGSRIFINKQVFYGLSKPKQIRFLLHEFVHVLHHSKSFLVLRNFKKIKILSRKLWKIVEKETSEPSVFLTGKKVSKKFMNSEEVLAYLMNNSIKWNRISSNGKAQFINELQSSQLFNLQHPFWKKRLQ